MPNAKLVSAEIIIGSQWGDEGKGKIIDFLSSDYVVRYQGGANAGHTLMVDQKKLFYTLFLPVFFILILIALFLVVSF